MHRRRWLIVGLCFCVFSGCVACQSSYDYCGPMPDQGGDFMYRKNSILGGDPSMPAVDGAAGGEQGDEAEESGPEPTPAPLPDEEPMPGMDVDDESSETDPEMAPGESRPQSYEEEASDEEPLDDEEAVEEEVDAQSVSTLQWHAPTGKQKQSSIQQVRFKSN